MGRLNTFTTSIRLFRSDHGAYPVSMRDLMGGTNKVLTCPATAAPYRYFLSQNRDGSDISFVYDSVLHHDGSMRVSWRDDNGSGIFDLDEKAALFILGLTTPPSANNLNSIEHEERHATPDQVIGVSPKAPIKIVGE